YDKVARAGHCAFVCSHTMIPTELVRPTPEHPDWHPYGSTRATLELITGWVLHPGGTIDHPIVHEEGGTRIQSYEGTNADAHTAQLQHVLPELIAHAIRLLGGETGDSIPPTTREVPTAPPPSSIPLGERALALARGYLAKGIREVPPGSNTSPDIKAFLAPCERGGKLLGLTAAEWCAATACAAMENALLPGEVGPHGYRAAVAELCVDARGTGCLRPPSYRPRLGDLAIFGRSGENPLTGGKGHVGRVTVEVDASGHYKSIDGNHNDAVAEVARVVGEEVAWIAYPHPAASLPTDAELAEAASLVQLSDAI